MMFYMQRTIKWYLVISTVASAILLGFNSERFNEAVHVITRASSQVQKTSHDDSTKQSHVSDGDQRQKKDNDMRETFASILALAQTQAKHVMIEMRVIAACLLVNGVILMWLLKAEL